MSNDFYLYNYLNLNCDCRYVINGSNLSCIEGIQLHFKHIVKFAVNAVAAALKHSTFALQVRAGLRRGLMGLQPQAQAEIGSPLYQVNKVIKVTDAITLKNSEGVI